MTNEEAIEYNKNLRMYMRLSDKNQPCKFLEENYIALDMAIKALEQGDVLDKVKAEIEQTAYEEQKHDEKWAIGLRYAVKIIDKHRAESEVSDADSN